MNEKMSPGQGENVSQVGTERAFLDIIERDPIVSAAIDAAAKLNLPDWRIVSGALYQTVWNHRTGRKSGYEIQDIDLFYFDPSDLSYEAEDQVISSAAPLFADLPIPVEIRNQARVHLWYKARFGTKCPPLKSSDDSITRFASRTHAVGVWRDPRGKLRLFAPFGLDAIFQMRLEPNVGRENRRTYEEKAKRQKAMWPELTVMPWPDVIPAP